MKVSYLAVCFCLMLSFVVQAQVLTITHIRPYDQFDQRNAYYIALLRLALSKTEEVYGQYQLKQSELEMTQSRALINLASGNNIDVVWTMTSKEREEDLMPIRIPLLKGLLGYRVFIIRKGTQDVFDSVQHISDLQELLAGQGTSWPDTQILKANGLSVVEASGYAILFNMLERKRFDYFPRGLNEPWSEIKAHKEKDLEVERNIIIQYPAPIYFFVKKDNQALAQRLSDGLRIAIDDGSFESVFRTHPANKAIFELANIEGRRIFRLENPLLPSLTPLDDASLWYQTD